MSKPDRQKTRPAKPKGTWGGKRPGAGAKKRPRPDDPAPDGAIEAVPEPGANVGHSDITDMARKFASVALRGAARIANSVKARPADVLKASELILTWGYGKPMGIVAPPKSDAPKEPELGVKETLIEAAKAPDQSTAIGRALAKRSGLKVVGGDE